MVRVQACSCDAADTRLHQHLGKHNNPSQQRHHQKHYENHTDQQLSSWCHPAIHIINKHSKACKGPTVLQITASILNPPALCLCARQCLQAATRRVVVDQWRLFQSMRGCCQSLRLSGGVLLLMAPATHNHSYIWQYKKAAGKLPSATNDTLRGGYTSQQGCESDKRSNIPAQEHATHMRRAGCGPSHEPYGKASCPVAAAAPATAVPCTLPHMPLRGVKQPATRCLLHGRECLQYTSQHTCPTTHPEQYLQCFASGCTLQGCGTCALASLAREHTYPYTSCRSSAQV